MEMGGAARLVGLFNAFDLNGDAKIDVYEWCRSVSLLTRGTRAQLVEFLFDVYDLDSTGHITVDKLVLFTSPGAQGEEYLPAAVFAKNVLALFDANGDDQVDKQEFMTTLSEHHLLCVSDSCVCVCPVACRPHVTCWWDGCVRAPQVRLLCVGHGSGHGARQTAVSHGRCGNE